MEGEGEGVEKNIIKFTKIKLILYQIYSTLSYSLSLSTFNPKGA